MAIWVLTGRWLRLSVVVGYSTKLWRGKRFETAVHIGFIGLWTYLTGVFFAVFLC
ncbi:hypothetical protein [Hymenobacter metallicola]|uniref:hypothetical protein n=1 Tax=Hymenobacter metallicola TaxID=2563114 RepID=UPI001436846A|nr:hypothetical protein [Hymenobacter metallicola]